MASPLNSLFSSPSSLFFFLLLSLFLSINFFRKLSRKLPYPPGPKGLPIIGNMMMMDQLTHRGLANLSKVYGGLMHMKMGVLHIVVVSTPEMARQVLQVQDSIFSDRPDRAAITYLTYDKADLAFANYGPSWRKMRKICVMKLFSRKRAESWAAVREEVDSMVQNIKKGCGSAVNIGELALQLTKNITYRAAFGSSSREEQEKFMKIMQEFSRLLGAFNLADFIPWLGWLQGKEFAERLANARESLDVFIQQVIQDHLEKRKKRKLMQAGVVLDHQQADLDMVDELIEESGEEEEDAAVLGPGNNKDSIKFTKDNIKAIIMDVMFGGTGTVGTVIEWAMAELMKNPDELKKVQEELTEVVGLNRGRVEESDLEKLPYFKCCIKETLRLHPPVPVSLHAASQESVVGGYLVPKGSQVMINTFAINRDKACWEEADAFRPERFLKNDAPDFRGSDFEYIPFGSGRRSCPGMQLGLYGTQLAVAHLLHCFNWELAKGPAGDDQMEMDMSDVPGLTAPRAIKLVAVPRYRLN